MLHGYLYCYKKKLFTMDDLKNRGENSGYIIKMMMLQSFAGARWNISFELSLHAQESGCANRNLVY